MGLEEEEKKRAREQRKKGRKTKRLTKQARDQTCLDCSRVALSSNGRLGSTSNFLNYDFLIFIFFYFF